MIEHWQDLVFSIGSVIFTIALIPAIVKRRYPPMSTCLLTSSMLIVYAITDATLNLWFSTIASIISAIIWTFMGVKQIDRDN